MALATLLLSVLLGSLAQISLKKGMTVIGGVSVVELVKMPGSLLSNSWLYLGVALYASSLFLWLVVLSRIELSRAYPMVSLGYLVTFVLGVAFFHESVSISKIIGLSLVMAGVLFLARG